MKPRVAGYTALASGAVIALVLVVAAALGNAQAFTQRISFVIATGSTGGTYFPIGEAIAGLISHPPGVVRCDILHVCGPVGLIASARTSAGAISNVLAVNSARVDSGLAQSDVVADAVAGKGPFAKTGAQKHIRVIADLFPEDVHLVAAKTAHVKSVSDLRGKRVSIGAPSSGTSVTARAVLSAWRIAPWRIKMSTDTADVAAQKLAKGEIDAFFFVGGAPVPTVRDLISRGRAMLVPINGRGARRLIAAGHGLSASVIPAGTYSNTPKIETVSVRALWLVRDTANTDLVYGVTAALFNPANRALLDQSHPSAKAITLKTAILDLSAPLHPGAARFYREAGIMPTMPVPTHRPSIR